MLTVQKASFDPSDDAAALRAARYSLGLDGAPQAVNPDADGHGGIWLGSQEALAQLGLERGAEVGERELAHALQGRHAQTGAQVRRPGTKKVRRADGSEAKEQRVNSFRLAFSAPKSVSVVWSQAGPELRAQIERAMLESAHASIDHFVRTREVISGTAVGRDFATSFSVHTLARTAEGEALPSPQLHVHVDLVGVTGEDGRLRTPNSQAFYQDNAMREAGALGRARLARTLEDLGFGIEAQTGNGARYFEIAGVPAGLCERMSGRSRDVAAHIQGLKDATGQTPSARAAAAAALATRRAKAPNRTWGRASQRPDHASSAGTASSHRTVMTVGTSHPSRCTVARAAIGCWPSATCSSTTRPCGPSTPSSAPARSARCDGWRRTG